MNQLENLGALQCSFSVHSRSLSTVKDVTFDLPLYVSPNHSVETVSLSSDGNLERSINYFFVVLPPSVVMSQKIFRWLPLFAGSIKYSPSPLDSPVSRISLQDLDAKEKTTC